MVVRKNGQSDTNGAMFHFGCPDHKLLHHPPTAIGNEAARMATARFNADKSLPASEVHQRGQACNREEDNR